MNQIKRDENLQRWAALIEDAVSSGLTREKWCEEHGISKWSYYYWNRKIKNLVCTDGSSAAGRTVRCSTATRPDTEPVFYELSIPVTDVNPGIIGTASGNSVESSMILEYGQFRLTIPQDVDVGTLQTVVRVMRHA